MDKKEILTELLENYNIKKSDAITFLNNRIGMAIDKVKMLELVSTNLDKLSILCGDLKLEIRLHESHPLFITNNKQFYTTSEAANILNVAPSKVRDLINKGILSTKKINQRNWQVPSWSLEAYKNDLLNFLSATEGIYDYDTLDITDTENRILLTLISKEGIHKVFEEETSLKRSISNIYNEL
ncbi:helix-turn-helix domain-containing protein [Rufibacter immobilis]|uniref:helix-turn-helix domain-containing protein n=1 Tax=Rufibacter immobilis TaxID=1348778 RepID=UPI0035EAF338